MMMMMLLMSRDKDQRESCWGSICLKIDIPDPLADKFLYLMRAAVEAFILPDGTMTEAFKDSGSWIVFCLDMVSMLSLSSSCFGCFCHDRPLGRSEMLMPRQFAEVDDELITRDELVFLDQQTMLDLYSVENQLEDLAQTIVPDADWFFMRGPAYQPEAGVPSQPPMWVSATPFAFSDTFEYTSPALFLQDVWCRRS